LPAIFRRHYADDIEVADFHYAASPRCRFLSSSLIFIFPCCSLADFRFSLFHIFFTPHSPSRRFQLRHCHARLPPCQMKIVTPIMPDSYSAIDFATPHAITPHAIARHITPLRRLAATFFAFAIDTPLFDYYFDIASRHCH
jgi:hypothetical protein